MTIYVKSKDEILHYLPAYACAASSLSGRFSVVWLSRGMYCDMIAMTSESMYRCNSTHVDHTKSSKNK